MPGRQEMLNIFDKEELRCLSPEDKREFYRGIILDIVRRHVMGVSTTKVRELTGFSQNTVKNHLEYLVSTREAYKREYGERNSVYFPNGTLCHADIFKTYALGGKKYSFKFIENPMGQFLYIQEIERDLDGGERIEGGIVIERKQIPRLMEILNSMYKGSVDEEDIHPHVEVTT